MSVEDLPPPPERGVLSPQHKKHREFTTLWVVALTVTGIAFLHRAVVPLFFLGSGKSVTQYAPWDLWWLLPLSLFWYLFKQRDNESHRLGRGGSFLCGALIVFGIYEILFALILKTSSGWVQFSHLLSSLPSSLFAIYILSKPQFGARISWTWIGFVSFMLVIILLEMTVGLRTQSSSKDDLVSKLDLSSHYNQECGAPSLFLNSVHLNSAQTRSDELGHEIVLMDCGFTPSIVKIKLGSTLVLTNTRAHSANFHLMQVQGERLRNVWNVLVPGGERRDAPPLPAHLIDVQLVLYSDAFVDAGLSVLFTNEFTRPLYVQRQPLRVFVRDFKLENSDEREPDEL